jgi:hypothetical protein
MEDNHVALAEWPMRADHRTSEHPLTSSMHESTLVNKPPGVNYRPRTDDPAIEQRLVFDGSASCSSRLSIVSFP